MFEYLSSLWNDRILVWRLSQREINSRFRGSFLGVVWAILIPLAMIVVYSFVFGTIFGSRWPVPDTSNMAREVDFPMILFSGLAVYGIFAEPINRAPGLIVENVSYVKKVVFPLEVLPIVSLINSLFTFVISFSVLLLFYLFAYGIPPVSALLLPFVILPLVLITLGISYFFASIGVFIRDLKHLMAPMTTAVLFLSPVFYSADNLPDYLQWLLSLNPITMAVVHTRDVLFWGHIPNPLEWLTYLILSLVTVSLGSFWFARTKKAFADVV